MKFTERAKLNLSDVNKEVLEHYRNDYANKTYEFVKAGRISSVKSMLKKNGSDVTTPEKPAERIRR